jgi:hypothetical protein
MVIRNSFQARILLESELIRLGMGDEIFSAEAFEKRIEQLEQKLAALRKSAVRSGPPQGQRPVPIPAKSGTAALPIRPTPPPPTVLPDNVVQMNVTRPVADPFLDFKNAVARRSNVCQALLVSAKVRKPENGVLTVVLEQSFAAGKLKEEKNMGILLDAAREIFGAVESIRITLPGSEAAPARVAPVVPDKNQHREQIAKIDEQARQKLLQQPSIADAVDVFGGEIIDLEE